MKTTLIESIKRDGRFIEIRVAGLVLKAVDVSDALDVVKDVLKCEDSK